MVRDLHMAGVHVIALESNPFLPGVRTCQADIRFVADIGGESVVGALVDLAKASCFKTKPVLILTNDRMVESVGHCINDIIKYYRLSWSSSVSAVLPLLQKDQIEKRCNETKLLYPRSLLAVDLETLDEDLTALRFPIIIKPTRPLSTFKTIIVHTAEGIKQHLDFIAPSMPVLAQEFIPGDDRKIRFGALYLNNGKVIARFEGRKLKSRPMGHTTIAISEPNDDIHALACCFFAGLNISGPVSLELKEDFDGRQWVIEPTIGRTDFWAGLCSANGVNLSEIEYLSVCGNAIPPSMQGTKYIWINGERHASALLWMLRNEPFKLFQYRIRGVYLDRKDIKPFIGATNKLALRLYTGLKNKLGLHSHKCSAILAPPDISKIDSIKQADEMTLSLFNDAAHQNIELSSEWFENLQKTVFNNDPGVGYYISYKDKIPVAILPLRHSQRGILNRIESLSNYYTSLYAPIHSSIATENLIPLLKAAIEEQGKPHMIRLAPMDLDAPTYENILTALRSIGWVPFRFFCFGNWYQPIKGNWEEYFNKREGQLRSTIMRKGKKFATAGGSFEIATNLAHVDDAIEEFNYVYARSWKKPEPFPQFIPGMIRWLAVKGYLRLGIARLAKKPIASEIWIVANQKASIFKLAHDQDYSGFAPGTLLTSHMMKYAIEQDHVQEIDYLMGDDGYKKSWMSSRRERWGIVAYNPKSFLGLLSLCYELIGRVVSLSIWKR